VRTSADRVTRAATVTVIRLGGILLMAVGLGALAAQLASTNAAFAVALAVASIAALFGGLFVGPALRHLAGYRKTAVTADLGVAPSGGVARQGE
jgi:hypothetical protein